MNFYQINAQSDDMIYRLIERMIIIDHHDQLIDLQPYLRVSIKLQLSCTIDNCVSMVSTTTCTVHTYNIHIRIV